MSRDSSKKHGAAASSSRSWMVVGPFDNSKTFLGAIELAIAQCSKLLGPDGLSTSTALPLTFELVPPAGWQLLVELPKRWVFAGEEGSVIRSTSTSDQKSASRKRAERRE